MLLFVWGGLLELGIRFDLNAFGVRMGCCYGGASFCILLVSNEV
jgi:hypothetical protein